MATQSNWYNVTSCVYWLPNLSWIFYISVLTVWWPRCAINYSTIIMHHVTNATDHVTISTYHVTKYFMWLLFQCFADTSELYFLTFLCRILNYLTCSLIIRTDKYSYNPVTSDFVIMWHAIWSCDLTHYATTCSW